MRIDNDGEERKSQLKMFNKTKLEYHSTFNGLHDEFLETLKQAIEHPEFPANHIRIINMLVGWKKILC